MTVSSPHYLSSYILYIYSIRYVLDPVPSGTPNVEKCGNQYRDTRTYLACRGEKVPDGYKKHVKKIEAFVEENKRYPTAKEDIPGLKDAGQRLSIWRKCYWDGKMRSDVANTLEKLPGWEWDPREEDWIRSFQSAERAFKTRIDKGSEQWKWYQRQNNEKAKPSDDQRAMLADMEALVMHLTREAAVKEGHQRCTMCKEDFLPEEFKKQKGQGYSETCNQCRKRREDQAKRRAQGKPPGLCSRKSCRNPAQEGGLRCKQCNNKELRYKAGRRKTIKERQVISLTLLWK